LECDITPRTSSDLHMHSKKLNEIRNWLLRLTPRGILLLTGPSGSGKTESVRVLCDELKIGLSEWIEPDHENEEESLGEFLHSVSPVRNGIRMVRHLPHSFYGDLPRLHCLIRSIPSASVIFNLSATPSSWHLSPARILPTQFCNELWITQITTNPFAPTYLLKALRNSIGDSFNCRDSELKEIAKVADGDLRKALIILDLYRRFGKANAFNKAGSSISLFHTIGRICYAKRAEKTDTSWRTIEELLPNKKLRRPQPDFDVNALIDESPHDSQKLISFVFDHIPRFTSFSTLHNIFDAISFADSTLHVWDRRQIFDQYAMQTVVRSSLYYNYSHKKEQWSKYAFGCPLNDQLTKEMRKLEPHNEVHMCWRKEYYTETVPMMARMGVLPPSMEYFSKPLGSGAWKEGMERYSTGGFEAMKKTKVEEEEEHVEYNIEETDESDTDSF
ncbi:hypothetical protein PFISCL1PPCAC_6227, partial [Pristionchus fissidentatus]